MLGALSTGRLRSWEAVYLVFGILVAPWLLLQFIEAIDGSPGASLNVVWVFGATAGLAVAATLLAGLRYGFLLAALAVIVSWSALWDKILSNGIGQHFGIYRGLLLILAGLLLVAAVAVWRLDERDGAGRAREIVTGAAVVGGARRIAQLSGRVRPGEPVRVRFRARVEPALGDRPPGRLAARGRIRLQVCGAEGPAYVGGIGLAVFLLLAGSDVNDATPEGKIVGWPLVLVIVGVVAFAVSLVPGLRTPELDLEGRPRGAASRDEPRT